MHNQSNKKIKGTSGATHLLNRADLWGLERWEKCTREFDRNTESSEENIEAKTTEDLDKLQHEEGIAFQRNFVADVKKVFDGFGVNPLEKMNIVIISNTPIYLMTKKQESHYSCFLVMERPNFKRFLHERAIDRTQSIDATINYNDYKLPGTAYDALKAEKKKLI